MNTTDRKITALQPGRAVKISGDDKCWVMAERSGDGKTLRYVRCTPTSFSVFKTDRF